MKKPKDAVQVYANEKAAEIASAIVIRISPEPGAGAADAAVEAYKKLFAAVKESLTAE